MSTLSGSDAILRLLLRGLMDILESSSATGVSKLYPLDTLGLVCMSGQLGFLNIIK